MTSHGSGFTVFFTGLPASGKSTLAAAVQRRLEGLTGRTVTLFDGDAVRQTVSAGLGYSREDRLAHLQRVGRLSAEITRRGGIALCAMIAPYDAARRDARALIQPLGGFVLVYLSTPLATCEARDPKGLYAKARAGRIEHFTGVSDPYEPPVDAEVEIDTSTGSPEDAAARVVAYLREAKLV